MNKVMIMGNIGKDLDLKYTPTGLAFLKFSVATTKKWTKDGQKQEKTDWHNVMAWGKDAENISKFFTKGRKILVEGRLENRTWDKKDGTGKAYATEVILEHFHFCDRKEDQGTKREQGLSDDPGPAEPSGSYSADDIPF